MKKALMAVLVLLVLARFIGYNQIDRATCLALIQSSTLCAYDD